MLDKFDASTFVPILQKKNEKYVQRIRRGKIKDKGHGEKEGMRETKEIYLDFSDDIAKTS